MLFVYLTDEVSGWPKRTEVLFDPLEAKRTSNWSAFYSDMTLLAVDNREEAKAVIAAFLENKSLAQAREKSKSLAAKARLYWMTEQWRSAIYFHQRAVHNASMR